jgi:hypothetical protein
MASTERASIQINMMVEITSTELYDLRRDAAKLRALEAAGVDGWSGYETAMEIFHGRDPFG